ncbi:MAG: hypothetical protein EBX05_11865, partial [Rhodobacteraceae bacterium]|nr:hypothetical protein [Paracoccaceae bacterium]
KPWRGTWEGEQGGAILSHSIHIHDLVSMILGPVSNVFAKLSTRVNDIEVEDCAALSIEMENGTLVTSSITLGAANDTSRLRFCFDGLTAESGASPDKPYSPADDEWHFLPRSPVTQCYYPGKNTIIHHKTKGDLTNDYNKATIAQMEILESLDYE